jgi:hypothetical protein
MAQLEMALGNVAQARHAVLRAEEVAGMAEEIVHVAWASKISGDVELAALAADGEAAYRAFSRALDIAAPRGLRPLEAHCHAGLAQLHHRLGEKEAATLETIKADVIFRELGLTVWAERLAGRQEDSGGARR